MRSKRLLKTLLIFAALCLLVGIAVLAVNSHVKQTAKAYILSAE